MKIDIKNLFKKKPHFRKGGFHTNLNISWEIILVLSSLFIVGFLAFGFYLFLETSKEFNASFTGGMSTRTTSIREKRLKDALETFADRERRSREIIFLPAAVVDPSR